MAAPWSQTPDLCLLAIFKHIPLSDLIRNVCLVCTNWSRLQRDELKRRRALVLIQNYATHLKLLQQRENSFGSELIEHAQREDGSAWVQAQSLEQIRFDVLLVTGDGVLREGFVSPLINILMYSNITQLTLVQRNLSLNSSFLALEQMTQLITHFSASLVSLKVDVFFLNNNNGFLGKEFHISVSDLFNSIDQLDSLRHLTLNGNYPDLRQLSLPTLSRLTTFTTNRFEPIHMLVSSFHQITANVRINCDIQFPFNSRFQLPGFDIELAAKFSRIRIKKTLRVHDIDNMRQFGVRFVKLTSLELTIDSMPMTTIAECLAHLAELAHLKLDFDMRVPSHQEVLPITQLSSVRLLTLSYRTESHLDTERLCVPEIFPNLQVLHLSLYTQKCTECGFAVVNVNQLMYFPELNPRIENCLCLTREPFRRCTNLSTVKFNVFGPLHGIQPQGWITLL